MMLERMMLRKFTKVVESIKKNDPKNTTPANIV